MADFQCYINDDERRNLFEFLINNGYEVLSEKKFSTPEPYSVKMQDEFMNLIGNSQIGFQIVSDSYTFQPLSIREFHHFNQPAYRLSIREGGPVIYADFFLGFAEDATIKYKVTQLYYYGRYIDIYNPPDEFKATEELKAGFNKIIKYIKSFCKTVKVGKKRYWVSKRVIAEELPNTGQQLEDKKDE